LMAMCHLLEMINVKKGGTLFFNKVDKKETVIMHQLLCPNKFIDKINPVFKNIFFRYFS
jgi:hypothetical protein